MWQRYQKDKDGKKEAEQIANDASIAELMDLDINPGASAAAYQAKRRRLERRDCTEQCYRLAKDSLYPKFGEAAMGKVNSEGKTVLEWMEDKMQVLKGDCKYWTARVWQELWEVFGLKAPINKSLPQPAKDVAPRAELLEKLSVVHAKNPVERSTDPLERFLEHARGLVESEMFGLLVACGESPIVSKAMHDRCFVAVLKYMGRNRNDIQRESE